MELSDSARDGRAFDGSTEHSGSAGTAVKAHNALEIARVDRMVDKGCATSERHALSTCCRTILRICPICKPSV
jgi:hypothetical protein